MKLSNFPTPLLWTLGGLNPKPVAWFPVTSFPIFLCRSSLQPSWLSQSLNFLTLSAFPSLPFVSCLIIEVSVCLRGAPQNLLIKASVCVCLFISGCYSRRSPGALMRHKPPLPTEAYTVSCHCNSSHSKHCQNQILSLSTSWRVSPIFQSLHILYIVYIHYIHIYPLVDPSSLSRHLVSWEIQCNDSKLKVVSPMNFFSFFHPSAFSRPYAVHLNFRIVLCGPFSRVTPPHPEGAEGII